MDTLSLLFELRFDERARDLAGCISPPRKVCCVGNIAIPCDAFGPLVYDELICARSQAKHVGLPDPLSGAELIRIYPKDSRERMNAAMRGSLLVDAALGGDVQLRWHKVTRTRSDRSWERLLRRAIIAIYDAFTPIVILLLARVWTKTRLHMLLQANEWLLLTGAHRLNFDAVTENARLAAAAIILACERSAVGA